MTVMDGPDESTKGAADSPAAPKELALPRKRRKHRVYAGIFAIGAAFVLFLGGFCVFANYVGRLEPPKQVGHADAIIVLTGGRSRLGTALDLLQLGKGSRLFISGVNPHAGAKALSEVTGIDEKLFSCLRRHRPCGFEHRRQCRRKREMGASP